jgi:glycerol-3-phosphate O-acyltransferase
LAADAAPRSRRRVARCGRSCSAALLEPWVELKVEPANPLEHVAALDGRPVCYVLEDYGLSNALILDRACREAGLPSPLQPLPGDPLGRKRAYVALSRTQRWRAAQRTAVPTPGRDQDPFRLAGAPAGGASRATRTGRAAGAGVDLRRPRAGQGSGWFSVLFSENWTLVGRFRRLLAILLNGRDTLVRFAPPVSLRGIVDEGLPPERTVRKLSRVLRTHFHRIRAAVIGPDLSTRRLLVDQVLAAEPVQEAIADQAGATRVAAPRRWKKAHAYAYEIAADYSHPVVRSAASC